MKNLKQLKYSSSEFKQIRVTDDYTFKQQTELRSNINEAKKLNKKEEKDIKYAVRFNQSTTKFYILEIPTHPEKSIIQH